MEIEIKLAVPDAATFAACDRPRPWQYGGRAGVRKAVHDRYLDTPDRQLLRHGFACRVATTGRLDPLKGWARVMRAAPAS